MMTKKTMNQETMSAHLMQRVKVVQLAVPKSQAGVETIEAKENAKLFIISLLQLFFEVLAYIIHGMFSSAYFDSYLGLKFIPAEQLPSGDTGI